MIIKIFVKVMVGVQWIQISWTNGLESIFAMEVTILMKKGILKNVLPKGKLVHIIKLIASYPAKPVGIIWNKKLPDNLRCNGANHLISTDYDDPGSWFVKKGFTVRSSKNNGYWYQIAFKGSPDETYLSAHALKEYEAICSTLNSDWVTNEHEHY